MSGRIKAGVVLLLHLGIVLGVAAKAWVERDTLPHAWAKAVPVDPEHPLRGRYVRLWLEVDAGHGASLGMSPARLFVRDGRLCAEADRDQVYGPMITTTPAGTRLADAVMFYIPEHAVDPSRRAPGEELWAEVAVSEHGLPRPVRLGVKREGGLIEPLKLR